MSSPPGGPTTTYCARHSDTPTRLRCGKCETLVCPQCMVHSPVGVRCADCANVTRLPTFDVSKPYLARALTAAIVTGAVGGVLFLILGPPLLYRVPFMDTIAIIGLGFAVGEGVSLSVNRKRGNVLRYIAAGGVALAYLMIVVTTLSLGLSYLDVFHLFAAAAGIYAAVSRL